MLTFFEKETAPLNDYENDVLLPIMTKCLERHKGREAAISNKEMCQKMKEHKYDLDETRTRKIINNIRRNYLIPCLMATNKGYYVTDDPIEFRKYIGSLRGRVEAINEVISSLEGQLEELLKSKSIEDNHDGQLT